MAETDLADVVPRMWGAFQAGDIGTVEAYVDRYLEALGAATDRFTIVPEPLRSDSSAIEAWVEFAVTVGRLLAGRGDQRLLSRIMSSDDNPIARWQDTVSEAQLLRQDGRFEAAAELLAAIIPELRAARGSAVDTLLGKALGQAGANAFDVGDTDEALRLTDEALRECERTGDAEGVSIYSQNLATIAAAAGDDGLSAVRARLARAQQLHDGGRLDEARDLIIAVLGEVDDRYRAKAHGLLGMIQYRLGDRAAAREHTRRALDAGRCVGDQAAIAIYTANLQVIDQAP